MGEKGCAAVALVLWGMFVVFPLTMLVILGVLLSVSPPTWVWIAFFVLIPVKIVGGLLSIWFQVADD